MLYHYASTWLHVMAVIWHTWLRYGKQAIEHRVLAYQWPYMSRVCLMPHLETSPRCSMYYPVPSSSPLLTRPTYGRSLPAQRALCLQGATWHVLRMFPM